MERLNTVLKTVAVEGRVRFPFPDTEATRNETINVLSLDTRSYNGLRRSGVHTIGDILSVIENGKIFQLKNIGRKSVNRILYELCAYQYKRLSGGKQDKYLMEIVKMNTI